MASVYTLSSESSPSEIRYVGISKYDDIYVRFSMHKSRLNSGNTLPVYLWMRKHNDVYPTLVQNNITWEDACLLEVELIKNLKSTGAKLLNCTDGGEGAVNLSVESRLKISKSSAGRTHTPEAKLKMSLAKKGKPPHNKGKPMSEESKAKLSKLKIGKKLSEDHKRKISESGKGRTMSEEHKKIVSRTHKGKIVSEETRKKLSAAHKGRVPWNKGLKKFNGD
jgi:hypothetical protein